MCWSVWLSDKLIPRAQIFQFKSGGEPWPRTLGVLIILRVSRVPRFEPGWSGGETRRYWNYIWSPGDTCWPELWSAQQRDPGIKPLTKCDHLFISIWNTYIIPWLLGQKIGLLILYFLYHTRVANSDQWKICIQWWQRPLYRLRAFRYWSESIAAIAVQRVVEWHLTLSAFYQVNPDFLRKLELPLS